ncbi:MAG TPA: uroporphyrinogen-III synthase [bacterium]|nr:uroporphyrinogen-III synthase [bacterium]
MSLRGKRVLMLEARLPDVLADLVSRHGGEAVCVPAVVEVEAAAAEVAAPLSMLCRKHVDVVVLQTGVGAERLSRQAAALGLGEAFLEALRHLPIAVRGPKPTAVLHRWGISPTCSAARPYTTTELCAVLADLPLPARTVFVQHYGQINEPLRNFLRDRGATTVDALPYRWALPKDPGPLRRAIEGLIKREFHALMVTSQSQVVNLFAVAESLGAADALRDALNTGVAVAAVGPVAGRAILERGIRVTVEPSQPKMAPLVRALAAYFDLAGAQTRMRRGDA